MNRYQQVCDQTWRLLYPRVLGGVGVRFSSSFFFAVGCRSYKCSFGLAVLLIWPIFFFLLLYFLFAWSKREIWWPSSKRDHWGPYCTALNNNNDKSFYTRRDSSDIEFQYHYDFISVSATCEHGCKQENEKVSPGLSSKRGKCQGSLSLMALIHPSAILKPERGPVSRCSGYRNIDYDLCIYITRFCWVWNSLAFPTFMFKEELRLKRLQ